MKLAQCAFPKKKVLFTSGLVSRSGLVATKRVFCKSTETVVKWLLIARGAKGGIRPRGASREYFILVVR
jgi:hypothetical protein